jgi:uncharacterized Tic20 family protein
MYAPNQDERTMAMLCHLTGLLGGFIPPANIIAPLIIWLIKKDQSPFVNDQGKEALNFQISMTIYFVISFILMFILIGIVLMAVLGILWLVFGILATIKAYQGVAYRYPLTIRLIR